MPQFYAPQAYKNHPELLKLYGLSLIAKKNSDLPIEKLIFMGKIPNIVKLDKEDEYSVYWKELDSYLNNHLHNWDIKIIEN